MAGWNLAVLVNLGALAALPAAIDRGAQAACEAAAQRIAALARANAPVRTGALAAGIGWVGASGGTYDQAASDAQGLNPQADVFPAPERQPGVSAVVGVAVSYGDFVELGTSRAPARPFLGPAAQAIAGDLGDSFSVALAEVLGQAASGAAGAAGAAP